MIMNKRDLTSEMLFSKLRYDSAAAQFFWVDDFSSRARKGCAAGSVRPDGYTHIGIYGFRYLLHHLVWLAETGRMPEGGIDHKNGDCSDSHFSNLRCADQSENLSNKTIQSNNKSGVKGVYWSQRDNLWYVCAQFKGIRMRATCKSLEIAKSTYAYLATQAQGAFARPVVLKGA